MELTEFDHAATNPDRLCVAQPMSHTPVSVVNGLDFFQGVSDDHNWVEGCSQQGLGIRPSSDSTYVVHWGDPTDLGGSALWLRPNLMVVDGAERLARPMNGNPPPNQTAKSWSTPVGEPAPHRWGENFSPNLTVQAVRFFTRDGAGNDQYLDSVQDLLTNELCIRRGANLSAPCAWRCAGEVRDDGALTFDLTGQCKNAVGNDVDVAFTPTYDKKLLEISGGDPILEPLSWSVQPVDLGAAHHIELDVVANVGRMALMAEPAAVDLGRMAQGDRKRAEIVLRNVGGRAVRVDSVGIDPGWGDAADFGSWILGDPKLVPLPIELEDRGAEGYEMRKAKDWNELPVVQGTQGTGEEAYALARIATFDKGAEFTVSGHRVTFVGSQALYEDPRAAFMPELAKGVYRPLNQVAFLLRETPFTLFPGESVLVTASASPSAYGKREAYLRIDYSDATDPSSTDWILAATLAYGLWGPDASVLPQWVFISPGGSLPATRGVMLINSGDMELERTDYRIEGRDAAAFSVVSSNPVTALIDPGHLENFRIRFAPDCTAPPVDGFEAELSLTTSDEDFTIPIWAPPSVCGP